MRNRSLWSALLLIGAVAWLSGCSNPQGLAGIQISPTTQALVVGHTAQFIVTGTYGNASHPTTKQVTAGLTWLSSAPAVATVDASGVVTALAAGSTTITASAQAYNGHVSTSATVTVTAASGGGGGGTGTTVVSIAVTPSAQVISGAGNTVQFTAIGTTSGGATLDLTSQVAWISSATSIATIGANSGLASSVSAGSTTISALYYDSTSGSSVLGTATLTVTSAASGAYTSLTVIPSSQSLSASGQQGQFIALATTSGGLVVDVTDSSSLSWQSSIPSVATVSPAGLATGVSVGSTTVTALLTNPGSPATVVSSTATVSVSLTSPPEPILSLEIIPSSITVDDYNLSGQFIAIATYSSAPFVRDVTNDAGTTWLSSTPNIFPVSNSTGGLPGASGGIVTAEGSGNATIIAEAASTLDGTIQTATATFNCPQVLAVADSQVPPSCPNTGSTGTILLSTLTVYQRGLNTTNWQITAPSATGTANVIHCGPGWTGTGGSVCTATYPVGSTVTLTSPAGAGAFGGWSSNCTPNVAINAGGPNSCTVTLTNDDVVGVIVN